MNVLRSTFASWPLAGAVLVLGGGVAAGLGCQSVLGIHDVSLDGTGGGSSSNDSASGSGAGPAGSTTGTGGQNTESFAFAINDPGVNVPYGGLTYVNLEITPSG